MALAGWMPGLFTICALWRGWRWGIVLGAGWSVVWLLLQLRQWWLPYLFGPTPFAAGLTVRAAVRMWSR